MERPRGSAVAAVLVVVALAACSGGSGEHSINGVPVLPGATEGAGTALPNGFTVAPGSVLLGSVLPIRTVQTFTGAPVPEHGWVAVFLVPGDPYRVIDHYRAAAARAGIPSSGACRTNEYVGTFECEVSGSSSGYLGNPRTGASFSVHFERRGDKPGVSPASHLLLSYFAVDSTAPMDPVAAPVLIVRDEPPPPFPTDWPALLDEGDRIPTPELWSPVKERRLVVEQGTRLVAPLAPFNVCVTGGFVGVFEVNDDPQRVVEGYARQFKAMGFSPQRRTSATKAGPSANYTQSGRGRDRSPNDRASRSAHLSPALALQRLSAAPGFRWGWRGRGRSRRRGPSTSASG